MGISILKLGFKGFSLYRASASNFSLTIAMPDQTCRSWEWMNWPFYQYGGHIEFIRFKEYYGMPRGHEHDPVYSLIIYVRFSGQFFFQFSQKKIVMGKKIFVACLDVIMIAFFLRNTQGSSLFARKVRVEWAPLGHPIILLKSNKFNMATVSVKRSIDQQRWNILIFEQILSSSTIWNVWITVMRVCLLILVLKRLTGQTSLFSFP